MIVISNRYVVGKFDNFIGSSNSVEPISSNLRQSLAQ